MSWSDFGYHWFFWVTSIGFNIDFWHTVMSQLSQIEKRLKDKDNQP